MSCTNRCHGCKTQWVASRVSNNGSHQGCEGTANSNMMIGWTKNVSIVPIHNFSPGTEVNWYKRIPPGTNLLFLRSTPPTVGVPSTFSFANFNVQAISTSRCPKDAYLSRTGKLKLTKSTTRTCLVQPITLVVTFSKAVSKLKAQSSNVSCVTLVKRDVRALSFELCNCLRKCHPKWD